MAGQKNGAKNVKGPRARRPQARRAHSPALTWLSLVGLLLSRAQLRFARHGKDTLQTCPTNSKPAKRAPGSRWSTNPHKPTDHPLSTSQQAEITSRNPTNPRLVLTRPSLADSNAPRDTQPCRCAKRLGFLKRLGRRVHAAIAATASSRSPRVFWPPPPTRSSRRIVCGCGCKSSSRLGLCEPLSWPPGLGPTAARASLAA